MTSEAPPRPEAHLRHDYLASRLRAGASFQGASLDFLPTGHRPPSTNHMLAQGQRLTPAEGVLAGLLARKLRALHKRISRLPEAPHMEVTNWIESAAFKRNDMEVQSMLLDAALEVASDDQAVRALIGLSGMRTFTRLDLPQMRRALAYFMGPKHPELQPWWAGPRLGLLKAFASPKVGPAYLDEASEDVAVCAEAAWPGRIWAVVKSSPSGAQLALEQTLQPDGRTGYVSLLSKPPAMGSELRVARVYKIPREELAQVLDLLFKTLVPQPTMSLVDLLTPLLQSIRSQSEARGRIH